MTVVDYILPLTIVLFAAAMVFVARRAMRYLHILQQDDYSNTRFLSWVWQTKAYDRALSLMLIVLIIPTLLVYRTENEMGIVALLAAAVAIFIWRVIAEPDPRKEAKKKLIMTARAKRIFAIAMLVAVPVVAICTFVAVELMMWGFGFWPVALIVAVQAVPFILVLANLILAPYEKMVQKRFWDEAHARLLAINPTTIGITGSFGKTSVKHMLGHVLEMNARTYFTPGSINTPMGIARVLRENMPEDCRYFLCEMGAYGVGSIKRLTRLVPPKLGIITAIGEAHYERFKSLDAVARAKFELAEAALANTEGKVVVFEHVLDQPHARAFVERQRERFIIVGRSDGVDVRMKDVDLTRDGLTVTLLWQGREHIVRAPIYGLQHAENMALCFAAAVALGVDPARVVAAMRTIPQIEHRLEVKPQPNGITIIDDAFNSNPKGFVAAMGIADLLAGQNGRRIMVTPGVAELGARNDAVHTELGAKAATLIDVLIAVRADRIPTLVQAYIKAGGKEALAFASFTEAQAWLQANAKAGDVVLYENDLPDILERRLRL